MTAKIYEFAQVRVSRRCPWCDARLEANGLDEVRKFDRTHVKCREMQNPGTN